MPWPDFERRYLLATPTVARPAGFDTDNDGMPNAWETAHGLNPSVANSGANLLPISDHHRIWRDRCWDN